MSCSVPILLIWLRGRYKWTSSFSSTLTQDNYNYAQPNTFPVNPANTRTSLTANAQLLILCATLSYNDVALNDTIYCRMSRGMNTVNYDSRDMGYVTHSML
jgi:hypothetical protein